jgi:acyl transferase domain-containing protein
LSIELIGFAKTAALTKSDMRVYDRRASGFIPGEGCGFVVLKRLKDAISDGNYIYAVIRGWGISSDGKGGLTAPSVKGQTTALQRAYDRAGYSIRDIDFIEGHGTGTEVGDKTELQAISLAMGNVDNENLRSCGITSLKSIIGHTKAASGIGGFIKAAIAVNRRVLPPIANCSEPNQVFENSVRSVYPITVGEIRLPSETLKAGVSGMGFGGINCHVTMESGDEPAAHLAPSLEERQLLASSQKTELFVLGASSIPTLLERMKVVKQHAQNLCEGELVDLAAQLGLELKPNTRVRAVIVAGNPDQLLECLQNLEKMLVENPPSEGDIAINPQQNVFIGNNVQKSRVGFLFPGQGSQFFNMGKAVLERHEWARRWFADLSTRVEDVGGTDVTDVMFRPLDRAVDDNQIREWSARPLVVGGHSLGELTAFYAAGAFDESALLKLASVRGKAMAAEDENRIMASLACSKESAADILGQLKGYAAIANINSPQQVVISGERPSVEEAVNIAKNRGIRTHVLEVSNAFHSRFVSSAAEYLRNRAPVPKTLDSTKAILISGMSGQEIRSGTNLHNHFADQVLSQVDFVSLVEAMVPQCDLMLEVGPGRVLSNLANTIAGDDNQICQPIESRQGRDYDLNRFLGKFFIHGGTLNWEALYEDRLVRPFVPVSERIFIENPCERPYRVSESKTLQTVSEDRGQLESALTDNINISPQVLAGYLSQRHKFIESVIKADLENLPPYHNSTTVPSSAAPDSSEVSATVTKEEQNSLLDHTVVDTDSASSLLIELVEKRTGFPRESLSMNLRLLTFVSLMILTSIRLRPRN